MIFFIKITLFFSLILFNTTLNAYKQESASNFIHFYNNNLSSVNGRYLEKRSLGDFYYVTSYRAYFHTSPNHNYITPKRYLVRGDYCEILRYKNGFGYVNYYSTTSNKTTSGWLDLDDLEYDY